MTSEVEVLTFDKKVVPLLRSGLAMKKASLEFSLKRYSERLHRFERQYSMDSPTFAARFGRGELGDDADWFEWEYNLDACRQTQKQLQLWGQIE